jgi:methanethiol oxidase
MLAMALWKPDPTFYPSPRDAAAAPPEKLAYVAAFSRPATAPDAMAVLDTDPDSGSYGQVIGFTELPELGDELHHFGWNMCSSALCHSRDQHAEHEAHAEHEGHSSNAPAERRYLIVPGLRSSRIYILDTKETPRAPQVVRVLGPEELGKQAGYSRPHTVHCGPDGLYVSCLGGADGRDGPGGVALVDHDTFEVTGSWELDRGDQYFAYDLWWHLMQDVAVTSEWGTPSMIENGIVPDLLLGRKYGHRLHFWNLQQRKHIQTIDLGDQHQMVLELRPAHDPTRKYGFAGVVISVEDLSASIWLWHEEGGQFAATKVITIPAEPAPVEKLPPLLQGFGAVPPLVTDIGLSVDDRFLYVSCWGTGELKQYDVTDPFHPVETGSVRIGGIANETPHPAQPDLPLRGGPQMVEVSRDGKRVYFTNSLYGAWDEQFYPAGVGAWMAKLDTGTEGGVSLDTRFFPHGEETFRGRRVHQVRLQGGDASSDSYCYP